MLNRITAFIAIALVLFTAAASRAAEPELTGGDLVKATLVTDVDSIKPSFTLGIHLKMKPHWHTYWVNPGESGEATKIKVTGPKGFEIGPVQWPLPKAIESFGAITYGYEDEVMLLVSVKPVAPFNPAPKQFDVDVSWLACHDTCIEGSAKLSITIPVKSDGKEPASAKTIETWRELVPRPMSATEAAVLVKALQTKTEPAIALEWKDEVKKVEWFPIATPAVAIENIVVKQEGKSTRITFKPKVYKPDKVPGGKMESVIVFEDAKGKRQGIVVPFLVDVGN